MPREKEKYLVTYKMLTCDPSKGKTYHWTVEWIWSLKSESPQLESHFSHCWGKT